MSPTNGRRSLCEHLSAASSVTFQAAGAVDLSAAKKVIVVGRLSEVRSAASEVNSGIEMLLEDLQPDLKSTAVAKTEVLFDPASKQKVTCIIVPEASSRNTASGRPELVAKALYGKLAGHDVLIASEKAEDAMAVALAVAKCHPALSLKSQAKGAGTSVAEESVQITFSAVISDAAINWLQTVCDSIRTAQLLVDAPPNLLDAATFEEFAKEQAQPIPGVEVSSIVGKDLEAMGMGGLFGVGKAAAAAPRMVVLSHNAGGSGNSTCLVGKGIVYDTGGLSVKPTLGMCGMKADMGGAAAMLGAFLALAKLGGTGSPLHCVLCLAENAVSENALRNDDVISMYSGITVEVNNTDAEGRLVLGDGVAYCVKHLSPELVMDMATLTGAQGVATGQLHGAIYCNDADTELAAVTAGRETGDYAFPLLYAPELHLNEFKSQVADMKNSVKNRMNAQSSCAASFILEQMFNCGYTGKAMHVDMAYPAIADERGTGYGVALMCNMLVPMGK